jgi:predicted porin
MKKSILALALFAAMGTAFADAGQTAVSVDYQFQTVDNNSAPDQQQLSLGVKHWLTKEFAIDGGIAAAQNNDNNVASTSKAVWKDSNRYEIGASYQRAIVGPVDGYARLGLGYKAPSGTQMFAYNSEEIGVVAHLPANFDAKVGYRWRQANDTNIAAGQTDTSRTVRYGLGYNFSKTDTVAFNLDKVSVPADQGPDQTAYHLTYTHKFN